MCSSRWAPGARVRDERERHDAAVVEAADASHAVVPGLREHGDRADAHHHTSTGSKGSTSTLSSTTPAAFGGVDIVLEHGRHLGTLGDRAAGGVGEVLAEVLRREMREGAEPDRDAPHPNGVVLARDLHDLPHQVVHQRPLVHGSLSSVNVASSARIATAAGSTAAATASERPSPAANSEPSTP